MGFPKIEGGATCSKWSGYTASNVRVWDHTAVEKGGSLYDTTAGGGCAEILAKFISEECENGFSTAYLLITHAVYMHRYKVNDLYQKIWSGYDLLVGVLQL